MKQQNNKKKTQKGSRDPSPQEGSISPSTAKASKESPTQVTPAIIPQSDNQNLPIKRKRVHAKNQSPENPKKGRNSSEDIAEAKK